MKTMMMVTGTETMTMTCISPATISGTPLREVQTGRQKSPGSGSGVLALRPRGMIRIFMESEEGAFKAYSRRPQLSPTTIRV